MILQIRICRFRRKGAGEQFALRDLSSLGVTLVTGITDFDPIELPRQGLQIDIETALHGKPALVQWLKRRTEPELGDRFPFAQAALDALQQIH